MILSRRADPPALILASRRSRRRRICFWAGDSSDVFSGFSIFFLFYFETLYLKKREKNVLSGEEERKRECVGDCGRRILCQGDMLMADETFRYGYLHTDTECRSASLHARVYLCIHIPFIPT